MKEEPLILDTNVHFDSKHKQQMFYQQQNNFNIKKAHPSRDDQHLYN